MLLSLYLAVLDNQSKEEQFIGVYNTYKRLVYHTAYKIMGDSYLAEDVLQEVFLYVAKNFSKIHILRNQFSKAKIRRGLLPKKREESSADFVYRVGSFSAVFFSSAKNISTFF